jgi:hypothetical protein
MQIAFERTGGIAGARIRLNLPEGALSGAEAEKLEALVQQSRFFELPSAMSPRQLATDRFHYRLTIKQGGRQHTVEVDEPDVPAELQPLLDTLMQLARRRAPPAR